MAPRHLLHFALMLCVSIALASCSGSRSRGRGDGDGGGGGGGGGLAAWTTYCETTGPERAATCGADWDDSVTDGCLSFADCAQTYIRADLFGDMAECLGERSCDAIEDVCYSASGLGASASPAASSFFDACIAKHADCEGEGEPFHNDYCSVSLLADDVIADLEACLDGPCGSFNACYESAFPSCV